MDETREETIKEFPELTAAEEAITKYDQTGSEVLGFGLKYLTEHIERAGEVGYTALARRLAKGGDFNVQRWLLDSGAKWLNNENLPYILDMVPRDTEISEHQAILLALKFDIAKERLMQELSSLWRSLDDIDGNEKLTDPERYLRIYERIRTFGGLEKLRMFGAVFGLAYMSAIGETRDQLFALLKNAAHNSYTQKHFEEGLKNALPLAEGKSPYRFEYYSPSDLGEYPPSSEKIPGLKFPKQPEKSCRDLAEVWKTFSESNILENRQWHRTVTKEVYRDPASGNNVPTIVKKCDRATAEREKHNLEILANWGIPVPKVFEVSDQGIRLEDLTDSDANLLVMDDFRQFGDALRFAANEQELQQKLNHCIQILRTKGVDTTKLERVIGVLINKETEYGELYFVDADHISLEQNN